MPYKFETNHIKIPRELDRRVKATEEIRETIKNLFLFGCAQRKIARMTGVSHTLVKFILFPSKYEHAKALYKERQKDGRYYDKKTHTAQVKNTRRYKAKIFNTPTRKRYTESNNSISPIKGLVCAAD